MPYYWGSYCIFVEQYEGILILEWFEDISFLVLNSFINSSINWRIFLSVVAKVFSKLKFK